METDINKVLRTAISTGSVKIGTKQTLNAVRAGKAQVVVVSSNCPEQTVKEIESVPLIRYPGSGVDLGVACGKPFSIAVLAVIEPGDSEILSVGNMEV